MRKLESERGRVRKRLRRGAMLLVLGMAMALAVGGCASSSTAPANAPEGHTVLKEGIPHRPGLKNPTVNCVACHGANLMGGSAGEPSCFSCHGQKW